MLMYTLSAYAANLSNTKVATIITEVDIKGNQMPLLRTKQNQY